MNYTITTTIDSSLHEWLSTTTEFHLERFFGHVILGRAYVGVEYINEILEDNNYIQAQAKGSSNYQLSLRLIEGKILAECSCPYDGKCKHLASLLLKLIRK